MNLHDKLILTDVDGVMLSWEYAFDEWLRIRGYKKVREDEYGMDLRYGIDGDHAETLVAEFNRSAWIGWLTPLKDAVKYVKKFHEEHGYVFRAITSFEKDVYSVRLRHMNLHNTFGSHVFDQIQCIGHEDKSDYLDPYRDTGCIWLEDKPANSLKGVEAGLDCYLFDHPYNRGFHHPDVKRVTDWRHLSEHIL